MSASVSFPTRRRFLGGALGVGGATLLANCSRPGDGKGGVTFLNWDRVEGTPLERAIRAYEKESGEKVTIQPTPSQDYDTKIRTVLSAGDAPDVLRVNDDFVRGFSEQGALLDLTEYMKKDKIDSGKYAEEPFLFPQQPDGQHTAWVIGYSPRLIFYNVDLFRESNVPLPPTEWTSQQWTWSDFLERAKALTDPGEKRYGALVYLDTGYEQTFTVNHGSPSGIFSEDGTSFTLADPVAVEALQWAVDLTCREQVQPPWSVLQQDSADLQMFAQGKLAMLYQTFGAVPYLRDAVKDFEWDVAPPPGDKRQLTESSVVVFGVAKEAQHPDRAWNLLKFLAGEDAGRILAEGMEMTPINLKAAEMVKSDGESPAHVELFGEASKHLTATNQTNNTLAARELYRPALEQAYNCEKPVGDILTRIKPQVERALEG